MKIEGLELIKCEDCGSTELKVYRKGTGIKCLSCQSMYWVEDNGVYHLRINFSSVYDYKTKEIEWAV